MEIEKPSTYRHAKRCRRPLPSEKRPPNVVERMHALTLLRVILASAVVPVKGCRSVPHGHRLVQIGKELLDVDLHDLVVPSCEGCVEGGGGFVSGGEAHVPVEDLWEDWISEGREEEEGVGKPSFDGSKAASDDIGVSGS